MLKPTGPGVLSPESILKTGRKEMKRRGPNERIAVRSLHAIPRRIEASKKTRLKEMLGVCPGTLKDLSELLLLSYLRSIQCHQTALRNTLKDLAGKFGTALLDRLKQPARRADIFRYIYHFCNEGLCVDIKFGFVVPWSEILKLLAADWGTAQMSAAQGAGYNPVLRASCLMNLW